MDSYAEPNAKVSNQIARALRALGWIKTDKRQRGKLPNGRKYDKATVWKRGMNVV